MDNKKPSNSRFWIRLVLAVCTIMAMVGGYVVYHMYHTFRIIRAVQKEFKKINTVGGVTEFEKLPMVDKYQLGDVGKKLDTILYKKKNEEFLADLLPQNDREKWEAMLATIEKQTQKVAFENFDRDWVTAVSHLKDAQPKMMNLDQASNINYRETRTCCQQISAIARYHALKGNNEKALRLLLSNLSLLRQLLSYRKANGGMTLIDAMIAIAIARSMSKVIVENKAFSNYSGNLFPLAKERLEEVDGLFPLVGQAIQLERTLVPSFFEDMNKAATKSLGEETVVVDKVWMKEKLDYFYPPMVLYEKPYDEVKAKLEIYKNRLSELQFGDKYSMYIKGIFKPFELVAWTLLGIATPNFSTAYIRECKARTELRGIYLTLAIHHYREQKGEFPESLEDLKPFVKEEMMIDFISGKPFTYRRKFDKVTLQSKGDKEKTIDFL